jgi:hypothetical protein
MKDRADWEQELTPTPTAPTAKFYGSSFKKFPEMAGKFTGIATVNKEHPWSPYGCGHKETS